MFGNNNIIENSEHLSLNFPEVSSGAWKSIFRNFRKQDNLARHHQIFKTFSSGIFVPFDFPAGISGIFNSMVRISEM